MNIPPEYVTHLDHRLTVLMSFTVRLESGFFGEPARLGQDHGESKQLGDVFRGCLEGSGIMLRALIEFVGVASGNAGKKLVDIEKCDDAILGLGALAHITPVRTAALTPAMAGFIAKVHDEAAKRTAHPAFNKIQAGLDPNDLGKATEWVAKEIWQRCYAPQPITIHQDIFRLLNNAEWRGIPFQFAK